MVFLAHINGLIDELRSVLVIGSPASLAIVLWVVAASVIFLWRISQSRECVPGILLLGNVIDLGRGGVDYLHTCRQKYGPDHFTLNLVGQRMTFLFDARMIDTFFSAPDADITFRPAVEQFTQRVFGLPSREFFPLHSGILSHLRHLLVPGELPSLAGKLAERVLKYMPAENELDLYTTSKHLVFRSAVEVLFGDRFYAAASQSCGDGDLEGCFFAFESGFEMAASPIPHLFQPAFTKARSAILTALERSLAAGHFEGTIAGELLARSGLRRALAPNMLLAILWASQANTVPATFWTVAFLLLPENHHHRRKVLTDLAAATEAAAVGGGGADRSSAPHIPTPARLATIAAAASLATDRRSHISGCVAEATRLRVQSIDVRIAARDLCLQGTNSRGEGPLRVPRGRILAICPFESHHDPALFGLTASDFNPTRADLKLQDGKAVVPSIAGLAFGGGTYRCPGRFFAEMEVALIVQLILIQLDLTLRRPDGADVAPGGAAPATAKSALSPAWTCSGDPGRLLPACDLKRLVGVKVPLTPCWVSSSPSLSAI